MDELASTLGLLHRVGSARRRAADDWVRARGLTTEQASTLAYLVDSPGTIQRDVARMSRTSAASVSSLLQGLERRGLVERRSEPGDERSKRVYVTEAGRALVAGFGEAVTAADETILAPLDEAQRETLRDLLLLLVAGIHDRDTSDPPR